MQGEIEVDAENFDTAVEELHTKTSNWSPAFHGSQEHLTSFAAVAHRQHFFAVTRARGGASHKPISVEYDLTKPLHRFQVW